MTPLHGYRVTPVSDDALGQTGSGATRIRGTCLYLGPQGQRCDRPALEDGFCHHHSPDAAPLGPWTWFRRFAALLVAAAILWPIIEAFLDELSHWRH
jgi:hypothetical protein